MTDTLTQIVMGTHRAGAGATASTYRRLWREYMRPHAPLFALAIGLMLVVAATTTYTTLLLGPAIENMFPGETSSGMSRLVPGLDRVAPGAGGGEASFAAILWIAGLAAISFLILAAATWGHIVLVVNIGERIVAEMQSRLYAHIVQFDLARLGSIHSGRLTSSFLNDTNVVRRSVSTAVTEIFKNGVTAASLILVLFLTNWQIALIATIVLPLLVGVLRQLGKRLRKLTRNRLVEAGTMTSIMMESLDGIRIVKAYGQEGREIARMDVAIRRRQRLEARAQRVQQIIGPVTEALSSLTVPAIIVYGGWLAMNDALTAGELVVAIAAAMRAYPPLKSLSRMQLVLTEGMTAAQRVFAILDEPPSIVEAPGARAIETVRGEIVFDKVSFAYADGTPALRNLSLRVAPGQKAALVGPSGAGKTTVLNLIPRFYEASEGRVLIDGVDVRELSFASLRSHLALVTQESFLFDDTISANIAYGKEGASTAEVLEAARNAHAEDFIRALPDGFDTRVGEHGMRLSGGQRQRIAIARAMVRGAPILLLDEATSALDTESERAVQTALARLMEGRTSLVIAHRLSTVMDADVIFVMQDGRVVEEGRHAELLSRGGLYARLFHTQFAGGAQTPPVPSEA
ncbi:MAG: ABC transporter ATP-binding protein [Alphaproteobacteria bacterium]|nr:ABC transporter ATP-binding protein [Alphaproteobacteria bacterium]